MIKAVAIKTFQKNNKQSDIMGVVRTLYPNIQITLPKKGNKS
jgi:uncharacterized protein (DUF736 family)